jgi:DNA-binding beta-propeller fold protein YncE
VLGAVAVLALVGRIAGPGQDAGRPGPAPAATRAPPQRPAPPRPGVTARLQVGHGGGPLVFGAGGLWVGAWRDRQVVRVDPGSGRVAARFPVEGRGPVGLAVDASTVWVVRPDSDEVVRLDLGSGRVVARIPLGPLPFEAAPGDRRFQPSLVAVGAGAGWVATGRGAVARVAAAGNRVTAVIRLPHQAPVGIAVAGRIVWVAQGGHGLARIDATTNRLLGPVRLRLRADRVVTDGATVWVGGRSTDRLVETAGAVARIDAATGTVRQVVPTGLPTGLAAGVGGVWVSQRDGAGGALQCSWPGPIPMFMTALPAVGELAVGGGAVWAADRGGSLVYRIDPGQDPCSTASVLTRPGLTP